MRLDLFAKLYTLLTIIQHLKIEIVVIGKLLLLLAVLVMLLLLAPLMLLLASTVLSGKFSW